MTATQEQIERLTKLKDGEAAHRPCPDCARKDAALRDLIKMAQALYDSIGSHYAHHDPKGTAGANCPACTAQDEARGFLRLALEAARAEAAPAAGQCPEPQREEE